MASQIQTLSFPVLGRSCASCASSVESILVSQKGVEKAEVNFASQSVKIAFHPETVQPKCLQDGLYTFDRTN